MNATQSSGMRQLSPAIPGAGKQVISARVLERIDSLRRQQSLARPESKLAYAVTRAAEISTGTIALIVSIPVMLLVALIVRLDTAGPVIFRQTRVGKNGRLFTFYKFRTLYADARERFPELYKYQYSTKEIEQLSFKRQEDPRVTPAGRWLRKSTLDELPNFWNLVVGDIALVGPRPEIPEMLPHYRDEQLLKFTVRPGITGLAQTNGRGNLSFQETIAWDLKYVQTRSIWLDTRILIHTARVLTDGSF